MSAPVQLAIATIHRRPQHTLNNLPPIWLKHTWVAAPEGDHPTEMPEGARRLTVPPGVAGHLGKTRQWILDALRDRGFERVAHLDDDLRFFARLSADGPVRPATDMEVTAGIAFLDALLAPRGPFAAVGLHGRFMVNNQPWPVREVGKIGWFSAFHLPTLEEEGIRFDDCPWPTQEDMEVCLRLLEAGRPNAVVTSLLAEEVPLPKGARPTGCAAERTGVDMGPVLRSFADAHAPNVTLVDMEKPCPRNHVPIRVVHHWRRAYEMGRRQREQKSLFGQEAK